MKERVSLSRAKTYWRLRELSCALFTGNSNFELRVMRGSETVRSEACSDSGDAMQKAKIWHRLMIRSGPFADP
jgi:hypothetical protein